MENHPPAYYRARLAALAGEIARTSDDEQLRLLRNGYAPDMVIGNYGKYDNSPLNFVELCSWDTWFIMYPEKVCGQTVVTTSKSFPLAVKGSQEDIIRILSSPQREDELTLAEQELIHLNF